MKNHHVSTVGVKTIASFIWSWSVLGFSATSPSSQTSPERVSLSQAPPSSVDYTRFIKFGHLLRTVAWIRRFICNLSVKEEDRIDSSLTELELEGAEEWLITRVEEASIPEYVRSVIQHGVLKNSKPSKFKPISVPF